MSIDTQTRSRGNRYAAYPSVLLSVAAGLAQKRLNLELKLRWWRMTIHMLRYGECCRV